MLKIVFSLLFAVSLFSGAVRAQSAPALQSVQVLAVASTGNPYWDYIPDGGFATPSSAHSGPALWVATFENGYSVSRQAKFNGLTMTLDRSEPVPSTGPAYGWIRYWRVGTNFTSGQFTFSAVSVKTSRNFSTFVNVR